MHDRRTPADDRERMLLTAFILGTTYERVLAHPNAALTASQRARLSRLIAKRASGVPLAYLTDSQWFYGRNFSVDSGVLVPRPETEHLIEAALSLLPRGFSGTVADIGTGSGCIGITIARERPKSFVVLTDRSARALRTTKRNISRIRVAERTAVLRGDLLTPLGKHNHAPDVIIANLPYATPPEYQAVRHEPKAAIVGGADGLSVYRKFFAQLRRYAFLTVPCIIEIDPRRAAQTKSLAVSTYGNRPTFQMIRDLAGWERVLVINPRGSPFVTSRSPAGQGAPPRPRSDRR